MTNGTALGHLLLAFGGPSLPDEIRTRLASRRAAGVTLFRALNVTDASQLRALTDDLQSEAPAGRPFVIAIDHEGGQLIGLGADATPFAGNMALGATVDVDLARRVAAAIGRELRAVGVNVNYAPVCDLATNPANPALGIRSFGDDPAAVARLVEATVLGFSDAGLTCAAKHFPGAGEAAGDPHHQLPAIPLSRQRLNDVELVPFRAAVAAGAGVIMTGHQAVPGLTGDATLPGTLSRAIADDLLRGELGFDGVSVTDALDMGALVDGGRAVDAAALLAAGHDLLLSSADPRARHAIEASLEQLPVDGGAAERVDRLRAGLRPAVGEPSLVGCADHRALADELAARSMTLLRDRDGLLPLDPPPDASVGVVMVRPTDRTPADTSSTVAPGLADAIRRRHSRVAELMVEPAPDGGAIAAARAWAAAHQLLVIGTIDASFEPSQAELVRALLESGRPVVTAALRTPWDLASYPTAGTHACTYSILPPSLAALTAALWGDQTFPGRLPVASAHG